MARALRNELRQFLTNPPEGVTASLTSEDNIFKWHALIMGPKNSLYQGGIFRVQLDFQGNYPNTAPKVTFLSKMFHPNVYPNGNVCIDMLNSTWKSVFNTSDVLNAITLLLTNPNTNSPANQEASSLYNGDLQSFRNRVYQVVHLSESYSPKSGSAASRNYNA